MKLLAARIVQLLISLTITAIGSFISYKLSYRQDNLSIKNLKNLSETETINHPLRILNITLLSVSLICTLLISFIAGYCIELNLEILDKSINSFLAQINVIETTVSSTDSTSEFVYYSNTSQNLTNRLCVGEIDLAAERISMLNQENVSQNIYTVSNIRKKPEIINPYYVKTLDHLDINGNKLSKPNATNHYYETIRRHISNVKSLQKKSMSFKDSSTFLRITIKDRDVDLLSSDKLYRRTKRLEVLGVFLPNLSFLQKFQNLETLTLIYNSLETLEGIEVCTGLKELVISNNLISDLSPLISLNNIVSLRCDSNLISDISPLKNLNRLSLLSLNNNPIEEISALGSLNKLEDLSMNNTPICDLSSLGSLKNLIFFKISNTRVHSLAPTILNKNMLALDISHTDISTLQEIAIFKGLFDLDISGTNIRDIYEIKAFENIRSLKADSCLIKDLSVLAKMKKLTFLSLSNNEIIDITPLSHLAFLSDLDISYNNIQDIVPLFELKGLKKINLSKLNLPESVVKYLKQMKGVKVISK